MYIKIFNVMYVYCLYFQMCIENENSIPIQNQTKSEYYGHDPQLQCKIFNNHFPVKNKMFV